jgi:hypothetical protein
MAAPYVSKSWQQKRSVSQSVCRVVGQFICEINAFIALLNYEYYLIRTSTKTNSVALSPRANYIDWETATCWRNLVPTFVDRGMSSGQRGGSPTVVNLSFLDRSHYFSFKQLLIYPHKGWVDPVPDPLLLRKSGRVGIEPGTSVLAARRSDH